MTNELKFQACLETARALVASYRSQAVGDPQNKGDVPDPVDPAIAAIAGMKADAANYPFSYAIDAAAKEGGTYTDPSTGKVYDFSGLGDAATASKVSDQMAQTMLDIQNADSGAVIAQRLKDLQQSDPTGYAARQQLFDSIMASANANPSRPLATDLQSQITGLLNQGSKLGGGPGGQLEEVQQGVRGGQVARGIYLGNAPASQEASAVVTAGEQQEQQNQAQAQSYLESGVSPEDVDYRRIQQNLSDLGSFVNGTSPQAEFGQLSGAGGGAAPFTTTGTPSATFNPNAAAQGISFANSIYGTQSNYNNNQVNPFVTGVQGAAGALRTASSLGAFTPNTNGVTNYAAQFQTYEPDGSFTGAGSFVPED